jgi:hypothetical protein
MILDLDRKCRSRSDLAIRRVRACQGAGWCERRLGRVREPDLVHGRSDDRWGVLGEQDEGPEGAKYDQHDGGERELPTTGDGHAGVPPACWKAVDH